jgi:hypothetical protein
MGTSDVALPRPSPHGSIVASMSSGSDVTHLSVVGEDVALVLDDSRPAL